MKKLSLSLITLGLSASVLLAQDKSVYFAPEAGALMTKTTGMGGEAKYKIGFKAGVNVLLPITDGLSVAPGVFYEFKGYKTKSSDLTQSLGYVTVPVNLQYDYSLGEGSSIFVFAGPYLGYGVNANNGVKFGSDAGKVKAFDWGFNFGLGYKASFGGFIRAQYQLGMANMSNTDGVKTKNTGFGLSVGYVF